MHNNTGGHSYEAKVRLLDDRDKGLDILQLAYMDHTMGMVIMLPRVKTNTWQATNSWRPRNLLAATPLIMQDSLLQGVPKVRLHFDFVIFSGSRAHAEELFMAIG